MMRDSDCLEGVQVWHKGDRDRLVLIVDIWHPDLSSVQERAAVVHDTTMRQRYIQIMKGYEDVCTTNW